MEEDCRSWSTEFETHAPADITAIGDIPTQITDCVGNRCNFTYFQPDAQIGNCAFTRPGEGGDPKHWTPTCCDLPDENCTDLWLADAAVRTLHTVAADPTKPFALFVGFHKPHPFWDVPQRFQDMYTDTLPLPTHLDAPSDLPDVAYVLCNTMTSLSRLIAERNHECSQMTLLRCGAGITPARLSTRAQMSVAKTATTLLSTQEDAVTSCRMPAMRNKWVCSGRLRSF